MTVDQIAECKSKLLQMLDAHNEHAEPQASATDQVVLDQSSVAMLPGMLYEAVVTHDSSPQLEVSEQRKLQGERIEGALSRIASDEYGRCSVCEKEIEYSRLETDPTATRCMECAS